MLRPLNNNPFKIKRRVLVLALAVALTVLGAGLIFLTASTPVQAHCDSLQGPVVTAAKKALETGDVKLVLPYVHPEAEAELAAAFEQALAVRKLGGQAKEVADRFFFETTVRLHREGEGAAYTGLKDEPIDSAIAAADKAMEIGSLDELYPMLNQAVQEGVAHQFQALQEARELAAKEGTVEANRERVEAELIFEKYIYGLHQAAQGLTLHAEGQAGHGE